MGERKDLCENCAAFKRQNLAMKGNECHRRPPTVVFDARHLSMERTYWPEVKPTDWCLDHTPGGPRAD
jgi:hypothetical protein